MSATHPSAAAKPFGRRVVFHSPPGHAVARPRVAAPAPAPPLPAAKPAAPVDPEFEQWKSARRRNFKLPWRQLSFLATVFFGIASLVLSDSMNDNVQWVLYALMAASFSAGIAGRWRKAKP
jgi:hypothetical protein